MIKSVVICCVFSAVVLDATARVSQPCSGLPPGPSSQFSRSGRQQRNSGRRWSVSRAGSLWDATEPSSSSDVQSLLSVRGGAGLGLGLSGPISVVTAAWRHYARLLETSPVLTKSITAGLIALVGDAFAQVFESYVTSHATGYGGADRESALQQQSKQQAKKFKLDKTRSQAVMAEGLIFTGPGLHYIYTALESMWPAQAGARNAIIHVITDELLLVPFFVLAFFFLCGLLEGQDLMTQVIPNIQREYWPALKGGWAISLCFFPVQFCTFRFLPLSLRVLMVNLMDMVWTGVVSFHTHVHDRQKPHKLAPTAASPLLMSAEPAELLQPMHANGMMPTGSAPAQPPSASAPQPPQQLHPAAASQGPGQPLRAWGVRPVANTQPRKRGAA